MIKKYQLWLRGNNLVGHVIGTKRKALDELRDIAKSYGYKRLPSGSCVCPISHDYYTSFDINVD